MSETVDIRLDDDLVPVEVRRNARARRLQFRLDARTGDVRLTLPPGISEAKGLQFVRDKAAWIKPRRDRILADQQRLSEGGTVPVDGRLLPLEFGPKPALSSEEIIVREDRATADLAKLLNTHAKAQLTPLAHDKAKTLGLPIARLSFRDTKTRWGSCSSDGKISLNWRIICAEPLLQDYLVAHEVAHLKEPHHQPPFWAQCAALMAQPQALEEARAKLRSIGPRLMALPLS